MDIGPGPGRRVPAALALLAAGGVLLGGCGVHPAARPTGTTAAVTPSATSSASLSPDEAVARSLARGGAVDRFGWVRASARSILTTYFAPGQRYLGGDLVAPTDQILVVKLHGHFDHPAPPGAKSTATLVLSFHDVTTGRTIPFSQMWDDDAPDLGIGQDPGIADRGLAARRWDLRLVGTPTVRSG